MPLIKESEVIAGVLIVELDPFTDVRGRFLEIFRKEWFPQRNWDRVQYNRSDSRSGVLRGLHYHFHQVDYWYAMEGEIRAGLLDIRPDSPTFRASQIIPLGAPHQKGIFIPVGVAHGFAAHSEVTLTYIVDNYYDSRDEYGVAWNDPVAGLDWGLSDPFLSERDQHNRPLGEIPLEELPRFREEK